MTETTRTTRYEDGRRRWVTHRPNIAKPEAAWEDLISLVEFPSDLSKGYRHGLAFVTAEFMRDAVDGVAAVETFLDDLTPTEAS